MTRAGRGLPTNPFFDGDAAANRSKVWALGFRNPFRLTLAPETDLPIVADVGWRGDEEINPAPPAQISAGRASKGRADAAVREHDTLPRRTRAQRTHVLRHSS